MTNATETRATTLTLADLSANERARVAEELAQLDLPSLAAAAGVSLTWLEQRRPLSGIRGTYRTPWRLIAAVYGVGYNGPADSLGEILRRLGIVRDHRAYTRLTEAAEVFGVPLPATCKDGAPLGRSRLADEQTVRDAFAGAASLKEVCARLAMSATAKTYARLRARASELHITHQL